MWKQNQKGAGILETLLVCIVVSILIGTVIPYYQRLAQQAKEATLQTALANIRKAIELYYVLQGKYPDKLEDLVGARYIIPVREDTPIAGEYLRAQAMNKEGNLLDPFGNKYQYNHKDGTVSSKTDGYQKW